MCNNYGWAGGSRSTCSRTSPARSFRAAPHLGSSSAGRAGIPCAPARPRLLPPAAPPPPPRCSPRRTLGRGASGAGQGGPGRGGRGGGGQAVPTPAGTAVSAALPRQSRPALAGALLGLGAAAKIYPGFFVLPLILDRVAARDGRGAVRVGAAA